MEEISSGGWSEQTSLRGGVPAFAPQAEAGLAPAGSHAGRHLGGHDPMKTPGKQPLNGKTRSS